jgi:SAM-dependent methyltransferase
MSNDTNVFQSLSAATDVTGVDAQNAKFYHKYQYPWIPAFWERLTEAGLFKKMLCQELGDWNEEMLPDARALRIWVAGCGTNQAVITALQFPEADILATDLSENSLRTSSESARSLGIKNIRFIQKSINDVEFKEEFDYIICTGVIHHNAHPVLALKRIQAALKPNGILEVMVYNKYHSVFVTGFQKVIQQLKASGASLGSDEIKTVRLFLEGLNISRIAAGPMSTIVGTASDSQLADLLLQPVWHSYDMDAFGSLCQEAGFRIAAPCQNQFDEMNGRPGWEGVVDSKPLQEMLDTLPDERRWQVMNHLLQEGSPMIWFYLARADSKSPKKTQAQIVSEFQEMSAKRVRCQKEIWGSTPESGMQKRRVIDFPTPPRDALVRKFFAGHVDGEKIRSTLIRAGIPREFNVLNRLRLLLTTRINPQLKLS